MPAPPAPPSLTTTPGAWTAHMKPVVEPAGWQDADYYCWGGLATIGPGEEGPQTVHFFGARWPRWSNFLGWLTHSEVCRATSASLTGPFVTREIVLGPRKEKRADGADHWDQHNAHNPILNPGPGHHIEDHFAWVQDERFHMLVKDVTGGVCGLKNATIHLSSRDGLNWDLKTSRLLYSPGWPVPGGWHTEHRMEQGNLLLRDGKPAGLYASVLNTHECRCPGHPGHDAFIRSEAGSGESVELRSCNIAIALYL